MFVQRWRRLGIAAAAGCLAAGVLGAVSAAPASAARAATRGSSGSTFVPFSSFLAATGSADYRSTAAAEGAGMAADAQSFGQMRSYILNLYRGVKVDSSFVMDGAYFDCVVATTQPSVRDLGIGKIATAPAPQPSTTAAGSVAQLPLTLGLHDAFGNKMACSDATIPMRRMTLADTTKFPTLAEYLGKGPQGATSRPESTITPGGPHRYAIGYQSVANHGGNSWLNLWNPSGEFSLSQQWYVNGSGSGTQTAEDGWVHYPAKFGSKSVLFIFFTPNNYSSGCYNLECSGFVQTSSAATLGGSFSTYSTSGGGQYGFGLQFKLYQGNWWLYYQGTAVGYYPGSVYNGGPMAGGSNEIEYGGETYTSGSSWPQMGSGSWSTSGWTYAAFQNTVFYIDTADVSRWTSLNTYVSNPACYNISYTPSSSGGSWGTYFYYGGPGGVC